MRSIVEKRVRFASSRRTIASICAAFFMAISFAPSPAQSGCPVPGVVSPVPGYAAVAEPNFGVCPPAGPAVPAAPAAGYPPAPGYPAAPGYLPPPVQPPA